MKIWTIILLVLMGAVVFACSFLSKYPQDNFIEEILEEVIETTS